MNKLLMKKLLAMGILGGKLRTVPVIYPTFGAELAPASAATSVPTDVDAVTGWVKSVASTLTSVATPRTGSLGSYAMDELAGAGTQELVRVASIPVLAGDFVRWESWVKTIDTSTIILYDETNIVAFSAYAAYQNWTRLLTTVHVGTSDKNLSYRVSQAAGHYLIDDVSIKKITFASMLANSKTCTPGNVIAGVNITVPTHCLGGLMINLDSMTNPQNGVALWINLLSTKNIWLKKLVAGVWTTVASGFVNLVPNGLLQIRNNGTSYEMWYNGAQVGTASTIADTFTGSIACQMAADSEVVFL